MSVLPARTEKDANRKATTPIGGTGGPDDPQFSNWNIFAAVEALGPMGLRPHDRMGISGWYNSVSDDFVDTLSGLPIIPIYLRDTDHSQHSNGHGLLTMEYESASSRSPRFSMRSGCLHL